MTPDEARVAIIKRFNTMWNGATPIILSGEAVDSYSDPFVILSIRHTTGGQESIGARGNRKYNRRGIIFVKINTPSDSGTKQADDLAHNVMTILESERFDGVMTDNAVINETLPDGKWYSLIVEIGFFYEELK